MKYRAEIDGLRAVAVLIVILYHAGVGALSGGFVGVDVFFVISGYLITSLISKEIETGHFSIVGFYERRARRILPALYLVTLCCIPFAWLWMFPKEMMAFSNSVVSVVLFYSNVLFAQQSDYFDSAADLKPLLHTWSLAVEEQYYILFPAAFTLLLKLGKRKAIWVLALVALLSLALSEYGSRHFPSANYYLLPSRTWELMAGALCSFVRIQPRTARDNMLSIAGLLAIMAAALAFDDTTPFPSLFALLPVLGACAIVLFARPGTLVFSLLSLRPVVGLGLISYSAYLWHQPLFAFARLQALAEPGLAIMLLLSVLSIMLAYLSWRFVEVPVRRGKIMALSSSRRLISALVGLAMVLLAFGFAVQYFRGVPQRFSSMPLATSKEFELAKVSNGYCFYNVNGRKDLPIGAEGTKCQLGSGSPTGIKAVLFGDSLAAQWEPFWNELGKALDVKVNSLTTNWCYPAFSTNFITDATRADRAYAQCLYNRKFLSEEADRFDIVILGGLWNSVEENGFSRDVQELIDSLLQHPRLKIIVMPPPAFLNRRSVESVVYTGRGELVRDDRKEALSRAFRDRLAKAFSASNRVLFLEDAALFGNYSESAGTLTKDGLPYSLDGTHISIYGSLASAHHVMDNRATLDRLRDFMKAETLH